MVNVDEFAVESGVCGLVGVNGAGKSTLLRTLAGCRRPEAGAVSIDQTALYGRARRKVIARIGYMPQQTRSAARAPSLGCLGIRQLDPWRALVDGVTSQPRTARACWTHVQGIAPRRPVVRRHEPPTRACRCACYRSRRPAP
ncbi:ATP-binding cassette domain-containing protein [Nocardioides sp. W3-2-3]|nr:ATP-binding cassette domain-containing protein [Nocardioides convexus]